MFNIGQAAQCSVFNLHILWPKGVLFSSLYVARRRRSKSPY